MINNYRYTWDMFETDVDSLRKRVDFSQYDYLVGIATGGLPLLTKLVNSTKKPYEIVRCRSYEGKERKELEIQDSLSCAPGHILLVDDVADSGVTLDGVRDLIESWPGYTVEILTLFYKPQSIVLPEWYVREVENHQWIEFPWE